MSDTLIVPILSAGHHRSPEHGGCFMEVASLLAGERWSDSPRTTHPALAAVARAVNDRTSDAARPRLAPLIPSVIGTAAAAPPTAARLVALCCRAALPTATVGVGALRHALANAEQLIATPQRRWRWFGGGERVYQSWGAARAINHAVYAIAVADTADPDRALRELLTAAIDLTWSAMPADTRAGERLDWTPAYRAVGTVEVTG